MFKKFPFILLNQLNLFAQLCITQIYFKICIINTEWRHTSAQILIQVYEWKWHNFNNFTPHCLHVQSRVFSESVCRTRYPSFESLLHQQGNCLAGKIQHSKSALFSLLLTKFSYILMFCFWKMSFSLFQCAFVPRCFLLHYPDSWISVSNRFSHLQFIARPLGSFTCWRIYILSSCR